jgi:hypothetical protein
MKRILKVVLVNAVLLIMLLQAAGIAIAYHHYSAARKRFVDKAEGHSNVLFQKIFLGWYLQIRPLPQQFIVMDDDVTHYWNEPGKHRMSIFERDYEIDTDNDGIRKGNRKQTGSSRSVMVLGDSHTWGMGVDDDETFTHIMNSRSEDDFNSVSCSSFGTVRQFLKASQLIREGVLEKPVALVLQYCSNDKGENIAFVNNGYRYRPHIFRKPPATLLSWSDVYVGLPLVLRPADWPRQCLLLLFSGAHEKLDITLKDRPSEESNHLSLVSAHFLRQPEFSSVERVVLVMVSPPRHETREQFRANERMLAECSEHLRRTMGKDAVFLSQGEYDALEDEYFPIDEHLNEEGHRRFAERILKTLDRSRGTQSEVRDSTSQYQGLPLGQIVK